MRSGAIVACCFIFVGEYRASSCWYLCWYRQLCNKKFTFNSNGYGIRELPARPTEPVSHQCEID